MDSNIMSRRPLSRAVLVALGISALAGGPSGCARVDEPEYEPYAEQTGAPAENRLPAVPEGSKAGDRVPGFFLTPDRSRFAAGAFIGSDDIGVFVRHVGKHGVIAVSPSGGTLSVLDADAPSLGRPALSDDPEIHNARVRDYFIEAGLPEAQIEGVSVTTLMEAHGSTLDEHREHRFVGYNSILRRAIQGIVVRGSVAWARFNADDEVVAEEVYWPEIPRHLVEEAHALEAERREGRAASRLPEEVRERQISVAIWHSDYLERELRAGAGYVVKGEAAEHDRFFDAAGDEVRTVAEDATSKPR